MSTRLYSSFYSKLTHIILPARKLKPLCLSQNNYFSSIISSHYNHLRICCNTIKLSSRQLNLHKKENIHSSTISFKNKKGNKRKKTLADDGDDDEDLVGVEDEEEGLDINSSKVILLNVSSLRIDMILRSAFQIARNKIEKLFYDSKLRVNGYKIYKKGQNVALGDEIDIVKGFSPTNPNFLLVQRVKILAASERDVDDDNKLKLKIRRYKNLTITNYEEDPYKESTVSD